MREAKLEPRERAVAEADERRARESDELRRRTTEVDGREQSVSAREAELETRAQAVAQSEEAQAQRGRSLDGKAADLAERERELDARQKSVAARELLVSRLAPEPGPPKPVARGIEIDRLEQLVAARRHEFPERAEEWDAYLFEMRPRAASDGTLPDELTGLVEDVFAPLL